MKNKINNLNTKILLTPLLLALTLHAGTYEDNYTGLVDKTSKASEPNNNKFMQGQFEKIVRFDMIRVDNEKLDSKSLKHVIKSIKSYLKDNKNITVTIIGHTQATTDDASEKSIDSDTYANKIQNWFRHSLTTQESNDLSLKYAKNAFDTMVDSNISKDILVVENRRGDDLAFSDATSEGKELSNRVMVTMYVSKAVDIDSDRDGIFDRVDECPSTPRGYKVDEYGCPVDSDGDGVLDYKDKCPKTPKGVEVDKKGCPLDTDGDGILDYKDKCPQTALGLNVDPHGCPLKSELAVHFKTSSDKILATSYPEIQRFAKFMKENPMYKAELVGHTDSRGKATANMLLSQKRAASVRKALISEGVNALRLKASGRGELEPIMTNRTKEGRLANRRTEVILSY